jgi:D-lactate dehydrogenase (cytochrome)
VGTSLEGHVLATAGGISLDMSRMDRIVEVNPEDLDATVEAGVTRRSLNASLRDHGLFFSVDPGADATIGGMAATGASGTTTVRYGAMKENVLSLQVVLADGNIMRTGARARKTVAGYDMTRLFIGSEGTLGVITEVTVRLRGIPEVISAVVCRFGKVRAAVSAVVSILQLGIPVARIEFLDAMSVMAINKHSGTSYPESPSLFLEFHGSEAEVSEQMRQTQEVAEQHEAMDLRTSLDGSDRVELWRARHDHFYASRALRPGTRAITTDVSVPLSKLADAIAAAREDLDRLGLTATIVGHVGDGNFHVVVLVDPDDLSEMHAAEEMNVALVERAIAVGGSCTGEHGIGLRKKESLALELPDAIRPMRAIKAALDPLNIMNPHKVLPEAP